MRILIVEDEEAKRLVLEDSLTAAGHDVRGTGDGNEALGLVREHAWDLVLTDIKLPGVSGLVVLEETKRVRPDSAVIMMTAFGTVETAVEAMKKGAYDFLTKPFTVEELLVRLERLDQYRARVEESRTLRRALDTEHLFHSMVGRSKTMRAVFEQVEAVADSDATVLVLGETGTGKEMVAEALHFHSRRRNRPLIKVSCVTLRESIIESELFGHERGAFSDAVRTKPGRFELADKGTVFLDDIDDVPLSIQPKLLRVLQSKEFERVGGERTIRADVRVIAATKKDLSVLVEEGRFRPDLYYRLRTVVISLPPLRERKEEIPALVKHFITKHDRLADRTFSRDALRLLARHDWPGNIRELEHLVEAALVLSKETEFGVSHLPKDFLSRVAVGPRFSIQDARSRIRNPGSSGLDDSLAQLERQEIERSLEKFGGNVSRAAQHLKMARSTLRDRIKSLGIVP